MVFKRLTTKFNNYANQDLVEVDINDRRFRNARTAMQTYDSNSSRLSPDGLNNLKYATPQLESTLTNRDE